MPAPWGWCGAPRHGWRGRSGLAARRLPRPRADLAWRHGGPAFQRRRGGCLGQGRRWWGAAAGPASGYVEAFGGGGRVCGDTPSDLGSAVAAWRAWWLGRHHAGCALRTDLIWPVRPARCAAAQIGGDPCTHYVMEVLRADPGENLVLGFMPWPALVTPCCVITFLKASPWRSSRPLSATSGGNPKSVDRMIAAFMCRYPLGGGILGDALRLRDQRMASSVERCFFLHIRGGGSWWNGAAEAWH